MTSAQATCKIVHLYDMPAAPGPDITRGGLDERAAFFWSHAAYCTAAEVRREMPGVFGDQTLAEGGAKPAAWCRLSVPGEDNSPRVLAFSTPAARILSVMGTKRNADIKAVIDFAYERGALMRRIEDSYHASFKSVACSDMLLEIVLEYLERLPPLARVHPGIYFRAYQTLNLMWQHLEGGPGSGSGSSNNVYLYGHSLGAACATLAYVWLRDIFYKGGRDVDGELNLACACVACPMFCEDRAWFEWFHAHTGGVGARDEGAHILKSYRHNYRHYFTDGDVFVRDIPSLVGFTRAFSNVHHVRPDPCDAVLACHARAPGAQLQRRSSLHPSRPLLAHSCLEHVHALGRTKSGRNAAPRTVYVKAPRATPGRAVTRSSVPV